MAESRTDALQNGGSQQQPQLRSDCVIVDTNELRASLLRNSARGAARMKPSNGVRELSSKENVDSAISRRIAELAPIPDTSAIALRGEPFEVKHGFRFAPVLQCPLISGRNETPRANPRVGDVVEINVEWL